MKKVNIDKLETFSRFARRQEITVQTVYRWEKEGKIKTVNIDGKKFVEHE